MSRYIDADAIEYHEIYDGHEFVRVAYGDDIDNIPTADVVEKEKWDRLLENSIILADALQKYQLADVVEVVRCKDCVNWQTCWDTSYEGYHYCAMVDIVIDGDFYCKDGERKILPKP